MKTVFITGATGYIGQRLSKQLLRRGHQVIGFVRKGSEQKLVSGVKAVIADPFDSTTFELSIPKDSVFVQLLGVSHPPPTKAKQFERNRFKKCDGFRRRSGPRLLLASFVAAIIWYSRNNPSMETEGKRNGISYYSSNDTSSCNRC